MIYPQIKLQTIRNCKKSFFNENMTYWFHPDKKLDILLFGREIKIQYNWNSAELCFYILIQTVSKIQFSGSNSVSQYGYNFISQIFFILLPHLVTCRVLLFWSVHHPCREMIPSPCPGAVLASGSTCCLTYVGGRGEGVGGGGSSPGWGSLLEQPADLLLTLQGGLYVPNVLHQENVFRKENFLVT